MIIGVTGKKRSGKDTFGDHLVANYGFTKHSFAGPLKDGVQQLYGFTDEEMLDKDNVDSYWNITPRSVLQTMGTEYFRNIDVNFWIKRMKKNIKYDTSIVITDCRFENELQFIWDNGGIVVNIDRPGLENKDTHSSEKVPEKCDYQLVNDGTVEEYQTNIDNLMVEKIMFHGQ